MPEIGGAVGLSATAVWESQGRGYATGMGFLDLDGDGDAELVVADGNDMQPGHLRLHASEDGGLSEAVTWQSAETHYFGHLSIGDVNGDGLEDVAVSRYLSDEGFSAPGGVSIYLSDGTGLVAGFEAEGFSTFACALGDMDRDGDLDLAVAVGEPYFSAPDVSRVYANDGTGGFTLVWTTEAARHSMDVSWADLDGDGWLDLLFANHGSPHAVYYGDGAGALDDEPGWEADGEGFEGNSLDWGDLSGDGLLDVVISDNNQQDGDGLVRAWCGPDLTLCWRSGDAPAAQSAVSLEDVDADGDLDLVAGSWWGPVRLYDNDGGLSAQPIWHGAEELVVEALAWEDVDGSDAGVVTVRGVGLVALPGRPLSVTGGVAAGGWLSGPGRVSAEVVVSPLRDLAVSDWDPERGERLYGRQPSSAARTARTRETSTGRRQSPSSLR